MSNIDFRGPTLDRQTKRVLYPDLASSQRTSMNASGASPRDPPSTPRVGHAEQRPLGRFKPNCPSRGSRLESRTTGSQQTTSTLPRKRHKMWYHCDELLGTLQTQTSQYPMTTWNFQFCISKSRYKCWNVEKSKIFTKNFKVMPNSYFILKLTMDQILMKFDCNKFYANM